MPIFNHTIRKIIKKIEPERGRTREKGTLGCTQAIKSRTWCHCKKWGSANTKTSLWCPPRGSSLGSANKNQEERVRQEKETLVAVRGWSSGGSSPAGTLYPQTCTSPSPARALGHAKLGAQTASTIRGFVVDVGGPFSSPP